MDEVARRRRPVERESLRPRVVEEQRGNKRCCIMEREEEAGDGEAAFGTPGLDIFHSHSGERESLSERKDLCVHDENMTRARGGLTCATSAICRVSFLCLCINTTDSPFQFCLILFFSNKIRRSRRVSSGKSVAF
jgi:hypothetical protein